MIIIKTTARSLRVIIGSAGAHWLSSVYDTMYNRACIFYRTKKKIHTDDSHEVDRHWAWLVPGKHNTRGRNTTHNENDDDDDDDDNISTVVAERPRRREQEGHPATWWSCFSFFFLFLFLSLLNGGDKLTELQPCYMARRNHYVIKIDETQQRPSMIRTNSFNLFIPRWSVMENSFFFFSNPASKQNYSSIFP